MCTSLEHINIPSGVTSIGYQAFMNCINLQTVNIPSGVAKIEDYAFYNCKSLKDLDIPSNVSNIGNNILDKSIINKSVEVGITEIELPNILKRAMTDGDKLSCGNGYSITNGKLNADKTKLQRTSGRGQISIDITSGLLKGLKVSIIVSGEIDYSHDNWTYDDVRAILYIADGERVINNGGDKIYKFTQNGEFEFKYIDTQREEKSSIAKVDIIDKELPAITPNIIKNEQGYIENITVDISDEKAGLWSNMYIGYAWSKSNEEEPTDWIMVDIPSFEDETKLITFETNIAGLTGEYYLWIYNKQVYDMTGNGFEKEIILVEKPYYLGNEPILQEIVITKPPIRTKYVVGESFKIDGMEVTEKYHNGLQMKIADTDYKITDGENLTLDKEFITINYNKNGKIFTAIQKITVLEKVEIKSDKYDILGRYILGIHPGMIVESIMKNIECNLEYQIINLEEKVEDNASNVGTGYKIKVINGEEYELVVFGDFTGDGQITITELAKISRVANEAEDIDERTKLIIDVNADGKIGIIDLAAISRFAIQ